MDVSNLVFLWIVGSERCVIFDLESIWHSERKSQAWLFNRNPDGSSSCNFVTTQEHQVHAKKRSKSPFYQHHLWFCDCRLDIRHGWCDENMCPRMEILLALACESFWFCGYCTYCCHSCDFLFLWWCALLVRNTLGVLFNLFNHQDFLLLQNTCQQCISHSMRNFELHPGLRVLRLFVEIDKLALNN